MARRDSDYSRVCRIAERGNNTSDSDSRARGEDQFIVRRTADRGNNKVDPDPWDLKIKRLQQRIHDLEASSMWEETELEETVRDDLSGDEEHPTNIDTIFGSSPVYDEYEDEEWYYWATGISMVKDEILDGACSNSKHAINFVSLKKSHKLWDCLLRLLNIGIGIHHKLHSNLILSLMFKSYPVYTTFESWDDVRLIKVELIAFNASLHNMLENNKTHFLSSRKKKRQPDVPFDPGGFGTKAKLEVEFFSTRGRMMRIRT